MKPTIAAKFPKLLELQAGQKYFWCTCGKSKNQPWCDGSHAGSDFKPKMFEVEKDGKKALCLCKHTKNPPYCDGSHTNLLEPSQESAASKSTS
jgi:CDGSH-type Zn-finger protein